MATNERRRCSGVGRAHAPIEFMTLLALPHIVSEVIAASGIAAISLELRVIKEASW
jgi:hypothetical protein